MTTSQADPHGVLIVDKAIGPTSHDVVAVARRVLGTKAIGHTGTLDPMATGVLVLAIGEATKLVNLLGASQKAYRATLVLGAETDTLDAEGEVTEQADVPTLDLERVRACAATFLGEIDQEVPKVSAVKVDGRALHELARKGRDVTLPVRTVELHQVEIEAVREREIDFVVHTGKGFYVRSFGRDLARALGTLGHLGALRRTENGAFTLAQSVDFEVLRAAGRGTPEDKAAVRARMIPFRDVCHALPHVVLAPDAVKHVLHGRAFSLEHVSPLERLADEPCVALDDEGTPLALVQRSGDVVRVARGFQRF